MDPRWDRAVRALASSTGRDAYRLIDEHENRTWARYCAGESDYDMAAAKAYEDMRLLFRAATEAA
jgi:hypothetical protein